MASSAMARRPVVFDLVVDSSAVMSILLGEATAELVRDELALAQAPAISAASVMEASMVARARAGERGSEIVDRVLGDSGITTLPVDSHQLALARDVWGRFGKGRHRAALNFGDCFSYALARHLGVALLAVGDDFVHTDLRVVPTT